MIIGLVHIIRFFIPPVFSGSRRDGGSLSSEVMAIMKGKQIGADISFMGRVKTYDQPLEYVLPPPPHTHNNHVGAEQSMLTAVLLQASFAT